MDALSDLIQCRGQLLLHRLYQLSRGFVNPVQQRVFDQLPFLLPDVVIDQIIG
tara:strand:+ start:167 stop:325 length:159 start_codon:yes stop_codon:yes gene_type:complete